MNFKITNILLMLGVALFAFGIYVVHSCRVPADIQTVNRIYGCALRAQMYYRDYGSLPHALEDLPERSGYNNSISDGYRRKLIFKILPDRLVFMSYGKDGKVGGTDENADIEIHYLTHRPDGSLWVTDPDWRTQAERAIKSPLN